VSGASAFLTRRGWLVAVALAVLSSAFLCGCKKEPEITRYRVPKEKRPEPKDQMLAAIVPHDDVAWFFKLAGNAERVGKHEKAFGELVQSVTFPESAGGDPVWTQPEGWQRRPGNEFRFATLLIPSESSGKSLELSISKLPWNSENVEAAILLNVNRWRTQQMQLPALTEEKLKDEIRRVKLKEGEAIFVNLMGNYREGMRPNN
jgi:hypothetical protein